MTPIQIQTQTSWHVVENQVKVHFLYLLKQEVRTVVRFQRCNTGGWSLPACGSAGTNGIKAAPG